MIVAVKHVDNIGNQSVPVIYSLVDVVAVDVRSLIALMTLNLRLVFCQYCSLVC